MNRPDILTPHLVLPPNDIEQPACAADIVPANRLFQGSQEILIAHNGDTYRLRITKNDKLILTK